MIFLFFFIVFIFSFSLTYFFRRYAIYRNILDIPNCRSSHDTPTPRGGGVAIVISLLLSLLFLFFLSELEITNFLSLFLAGTIVASVGFLDDKSSLPARWRLIGHFLAAVLALVSIGGVPRILIFGLQLDLGWFGYVIFLFYLVWMLNLYNFMDGIDGLASLEAISVCLGMSIIYIVMGYEHLAALPLILSMSVLGFLCWNFPIAKIFMGDAGSGFLGILLGILSLQAAWTYSEFLWCWLILLGVFIVDATFTLTRRFVRGKKVYEAHRSHSYQIASRRLGKHLPVTLIAITINVLWLFPISILVALSWVSGVIGILSAYAPLVLLAFYLGAGNEE
ncbi:MraY family glycosyltransferase [Pseudomonas marginalis]|uniref:Uncharacterized protein n=1 Tax=Pseudomonas marginalis pv. marginalis TaxID=97473 RepID=A0A3M4AMN5_PSEMA|nr:glycosyltransferase family 4 protein [Pseudomonas marginalis]RMP07446.1 hypothetical protein ALQ29_200037 [Pseudomonas marginalis pv. marginalis]